MPDIKPIAWKYELATVFAVRMRIMFAMMAGASLVLCFWFSALGNIRAGIGAIVVAMLCLIVANKKEM